MIPLKEDGSLDIDRINRLSINDYINVIENLTEQQLEYYNSTIPINESRQHTKAVFVDYTMEDEIERGAINIMDYLDKKKDTIEFNYV